MYASMDATVANKYTLLPKANQKRDHRRFDKEKPKPYLDWSDFYNFMDDQLDGERPGIIDDIIRHLTGVELTAVK